MEGFCYHHKRLSKFGAPKKPLSFQGGGFLKAPNTDDEVVDAGGRMKCPS